MVKVNHICPDQNFVMPELAQWELLKSLLALLLQYTKKGKDFFATTQQSSTAVCVI